MTTIRLTLCVLLFAGCAGVNTAVRDLGDNALAELREQQPELFAIERQLADSAGLFLRQALEDQVLSTSRATLDDMLNQTRREADILMGRVAGNIRGDLNQSLQTMLDANFELAEARGARLAEILVSTAILEATRSIDTLLVAAVATASRSVQRDLSPVLLSVVDHLTDSLSVKIKELSDQLEESGGRIAWKVVLPVGGVLLLGIGLVGFWAVRKERKQVSHVLFETVENLESDRKYTADDIRGLIKQNAKSSGAITHLRKRLDKWRAKRTPATRANPDPQARRGPGPSKDTNSRR